MGWVGQKLPHTYVKMLRAQAWSGQPSCSLWLQWASSWWGSRSPHSTDKWCSVQLMPEHLCFYKVMKHLLRHSSLPLRSEREACWGSFGSWTSCTLSLELYCSLEEPTSVPQPTWEVAHLDQPTVLWWVGADHPASQLCGHGGMYACGSISLHHSCHCPPPPAQILSCFPNAAEENYHKLGWFKQQHPLTSGVYYFPEIQTKMWQRWVAWRLWGRFSCLCPGCWGSPAILGIPLLWGFKTPISAFICLHVAFTLSLCILSPSVSLGNWPLSLGPILMIS